MAAVPSARRAVGVELPAAGSDPQAAERLYERHYARVLRFCRRRLASPEDAEDAAQTTFTYALRALRRGVVPEVEIAWLLTIARNVCRTRWEAARRLGRVEVARDLRGERQVGSRIDLGSLLTAVKSLFTGAGAAVKVVAVASVLVTASALAGPPLAHRIAPGHGRRPAPAPMSKQAPAQPSMASSPAPAGKAPRPRAAQPSPPRAGAPATVARPTGSTPHGAAASPEPPSAGKAPDAPADPAGPAPSADAPSSAPSPAPPPAPASAPVPTPPAPTVSVPAAPIVPGVDPPPLPSPSLPSVPDVPIDPPALPPTPTVSTPIAPPSLP